METIVYALTDKDWWSRHPGCDPRKSTKVSWCSATRYSKLKEQEIAFLQLLHMLSCVFVTEPARCRFYEVCCWPFFRYFSMIRYITTSIMDAFQQQKRRYMISFVFLICSAYIRIYQTFYSFPNSHLDCWFSNQVYNAARHAAIHDTIMRFPEKYSTVVGERGLKVRSSFFLLDQSIWPGYTIECSSVLPFWVGLDLELLELMGLLGQSIKY